MLQVQNSNNTPKIQAYYNFLTKNSYFLKASAKTKNPKKKIFSNHCTGCSFLAHKTLSNGYRKLLKSVQSYSTNFMSLQLPFIIFGLERTTNYIEYFTVGVAKEGKWAKEWTPLIPNSHVFVFPVGMDSDKWVLEMFVNPTNAIILIMGLSVVVMVMLGFWWGWLWKLERKKDLEFPDVVRKFKVD